MDDRRRVVCDCGWAGRRAEEGGACRDCGEPVAFAPRRAPSSPEGPRVRRVVHLLPATSEALPTATDLARVLDEYVAMSAVAPRKKRSGKGGTT
jgi:hypothetical protein